MTKIQNLLMSEKKRKLVRNRLYEFEDKCISFLETGEKEGLDGLINLIRQINTGENDPMLAIRQAFVDMTKQEKEKLLGPIIEEVYNIIKKKNRSVVSAVKLAEVRVLEWFLMASGVFLFMKEHNPDELKKILGVEAKDKEMQISFDTEIFKIHRWKEYVTHLKSIGFSKRELVKILSGAEHVIFKEKK